MEREKRQFDSIDDYFKSTMAKFTKDPNLWEGIDNEKLKVDFKKYNNNLDEIQKSL